jgi:tRNA-dihydrouridine synthase
MLGRGALANPTLAYQCARYLGLCEDNPELSCDPSDWVVWRRLLDQLVTRSRNRAESDRRTLSRVKQWLNYAHHKGSITWFDAVKRVRDTAELQRALADLAERADVKDGSRPRMAA